MLILLTGPKGSGKSHVGRLLEAHFGVHFFHVEPLWMAYYEECRAGGREPAIVEGLARLQPRLAEVLGTYEHVSVETTGASTEILEGLMALAPAANRLVVRLRVPLPVCLERVGRRDKADQIPMDPDAIRRVHELSEAAVFEADLVIDNVGLSDADLTGLLARALRAS